MLRRNKNRKSKSKSPLRVAFIGIDGSGKTTAFELLKKQYGKKAGYFKIRGYRESGKVAKKTAKLIDRIGQVGKNKKSSLPQLAWKTGYYFTFPFFKLANEKGKKLMIYDRYPPIDLEIMKSIEEKKFPRALYSAAKHFSGAKLPEVVFVTRRKPEEAMREIEKRGKRDNFETLENLRKMDKELEEEIKNLKRKGVRVVELDVDKLIELEDKGLLTRERFAEGLKKVIEDEEKKRKRGIRKV